MKSTRVRTGIDVGYDTTKVVTDGFKDMFPSDVGYAKDLTFTLRDEKTAPWEVVEFVDEKFFVGSMARHCNIKVQLKTRDWIKSKFYGALMTSAIQRLKAHIPDMTDIIIVTGLPVNYMGDRQEAETVIRKVCYNLGVNIIAVSIIPQPFGSFFSLFFNDDGTVNESMVARVTGRMGVIDGGGRTVDWILIEDAKHYIERASGSIQSGAFEIYQIVAKELQSKHKKDTVSPKDAEICVRTRKFRVNGTVNDESDLVEKVLSQVGQKVRGIIKNQWSPEGDVDLVLVTGGSGALLNQQLSSIAHEMIMAANPQMENAIGYWKRAVILDKKTSS